jgi:hypothetical protein
MFGFGQEAGKPVDEIGSACHRYTPSFLGDRERDRRTYTSSWPGSQRKMRVLRSVGAGQAIREMMRGQQSVKQLPSDDWYAEVLGLDHAP